MTQSVFSLQSEIETGSIDMTQSTFVLDGRPRLPDTLGSPSGVKKEAWSAGFMASTMPSTSSSRATAAVGLRSPALHFLKVNTGTPK